ncbi:MAG: N-acetylmuramoyl-L-alanine amidase [Acidobacteria bacterium]|nr:N-acetylmuramoyl-L-alanine amidase [Acidobacteriota bacterium]MBS1867731.1 N-acetylmuramoyl-L-alanine amidase [Acidobacteriota bacterium]
MSGFTRKTIWSLGAIALLGGIAARPQSSLPAAGQTPASQTAAAPIPQQTGLNVVILDPAHGGTDPGARGTGGVRESDIVLEMAAQVKRGLEAQGFQVLQTRTANENPSFDDRSALVNAQSGAIFLSLHVSSTGLSGTVRVYAMPDMALAPANGGLIPWEQAQAAYLPLSRKLGDAVQGELAQKFKGSPAEVQTASIRQLRTTAAPAIAVELSSVSIPDKADLDKLLPGVADAIVRGVVTFRPSYVTAAPASISSAPAAGAKP